MQNDAKPLVASLPPSSPVKAAHHVYWPCLGKEGMKWSASMWLCIPVTLKQLCILCAHLLFKSCFSHQSLGSAEIIASYVKIMEGLGSRQPLLRHLALPHCQCLANMNVFRINRSVLDLYSPGLGAANLFYFARGWSTPKSWYVTGATVTGKRRTAGWGVLAQSRVNGWRKSRKWTLKCQQQICDTSNLCSLLR